MSEIEQALAFLRARQSAYLKYRRYYDGDQPLAFATDKFRNAFGSVLKEFAYNLCAVVVDTPADRLEVTGFGVEGSDTSTAGADAWAIWQQNRMDVRAGEAHQEALRSGDAYVIVWPDETGQPILYPQPACLMAICYDEEQPGKTLWASKIWQTREKLVRLNLYYPDRIEKYVTRSKSDGLPEKAQAFEPYAEQPEVPNPWGVVPVFHLANNGGMDGMGRSELRNICALQDALNKSICDLLVSMEYVAYPQRWATGLEVEIDPQTGKPKLPFVPGVDRVWTLENDTARLGEFPQADLTKIVAVNSDFEQKICRIAGIPPHYVALITDPPSGEALKTLEARFVKKIRDRQAAFGNAWEDALALALRMADKGEAQLSCEWADPAPKTEKELVDTVRTKRDIGISQQQAFRELGYGEKDIQTMLDENDEARAQAVPAAGNPFGGQA